MENASKALLIAGAILLAILIISLGIGVYRGANDTINNNNMSASEIDAFNLKWSSYFGDKVSASRVNSLLNAVMSHNQSEYSAGTNRFVTITLTAGTGYSGGTVGPLTDAVKSESGSVELGMNSLRVTAITTYNVKAADQSSGGSLKAYNNYGLIRHITITPNT